MALPASILQVLHTDRDSGPQRSLIPRLEHLRDRGATVTTLVPRLGPAAGLAERLGPVVAGGPEAMTVPRSPVALARNLRSIKAAADAVGQEAARRDADLVVVSSALMPGALRGAKSSGAGVLLYAGEHLPDSGTRALLSAATARYAGRSADSIVTCSNYAAQSYRRRGIDVQVVWPPVEPPADSPGDRAQRAEALREELNVPGFRPVICSLGAITEGRGQDTLIDAVALLASQGVDVGLWIAGEAYARRQDREFLATLQRLARDRGIEDRVAFLGRVEDTAALFQASEVFVNPARIPEAFGRASIEALLAGCPVISTDVGGVGEALEDSSTALLIPPDSPGDLASAIKRLLQHPDQAAEMTERGRRHSLEHFSAEAGNPTFIAAVDHALS